MNEKADSELVRRQNRRIVLDALRQHGNLARVELGRTTGLSPASITAISSQLIAENIIREVDVPMGRALTGKRGRPIVRLSLNAGAAYVVAVTISIDDVVMVLADFQGTIVAEKDVRIPTYASEQQGFGKLLAEELAQFIAGNKVSLRQVSRVGVAVQGWADKPTGSITWSPAFRARHVPLSEHIVARLGVPVMIANDANMIADGLLASDRVRYQGVTAVVFSGYGVGMGLIIDGEVYHGATGAAAEFGHMNHIPGGAPCRCGRRGCLEAYVAEYGILRTARGEVDRQPLYAAVDQAETAALMARATAGDAAARHAFEVAGEALGYGLARMIALLNPARIVLAGFGATMRALTEPAMRKALSDGVVVELSAHVEIEWTSFDTDMIVKGTIDALLRAVDHEVFSPRAQQELMEYAK